MNKEAIRVDAKSCLTLCDPMDCRMPLSMRFFRQEYWSGLPFPLPGDHSDARVEPTSPALAGRLVISEPPVKPLNL